MARSNWSSTIHARRTHRTGSHPAGAAVQRQSLLQPRDARDTAKDKCKDIAIVRVEQLYPFPEKELGEVLAKYGRKQEVVWVQEEPKNRGAWRFMQPRLRAMLPDTIVQLRRPRRSRQPGDRLDEGSRQGRARHRRPVAGSEPASAVVQNVTAPGTAATATSPTPVSG